MNLRLFMKKHHQTVLRNNLPGPFSLYFFFRKPRTSIFLSVFVVVRVTPCLLCKYKSYIAFSSLSLNSKTFTEWLSVTVNDTVQCLVNQCTSSEWYSSSLKVGLPIYVVRASAE